MDNIIELFSNNAPVIVTVLVAIAIFVYAYKTKKLEVTGFFKLYLKSNSGKIAKELHKKLPDKIEKLVDVNDIKNIIDLAIDELIEFLEKDFEKAKKK